MLERTYSGNSTMLLDQTPIATVVIFQDVQRVKSFIYGGRLESPHHSTQNVKDYLIRSYDQDLTYLNIYIFVMGFLTIGYKAESK